MNVPKLRFKEFNDEWDYDLLKNISFEISYGMNSTSKEYDGENKYIRISDIDEKTNKYLYEDIVSPDGELEDKYLLKNNDILFARTGASTGKTYLYNPKDGKMYFAGFLIKANIINHNSNFIFQQTKLNKFNKWIKIMSMRSGQPGINSQEYGNYKFSLTSIQEENKISNFLSLLDKKIELQSKKIEALKLYKKGLIKLSIKQSKVYKIPLKELLKEYNEKSTVNNQYEVISSTTKGLFLQNVYFNKQQASENNIGYKILKKGQLVISPQNLWMGNINLNTKYNIGIVSPSYKIYDINTKKIDINYFNYWIKTPKALYQYLISSEQGASVVRRNLNFDLFYEITIDLPTKLEQIKVGKFINIFEQKILLEENYLIQLNTLKKGLMQNMFV